MISQTFFLCVLMCIFFFLTIGFLVFCRLYDNGYFEKEDFSTREIYICDDEDIAEIGKGLNDLIEGKISDIEISNMSLDDFKKLYKIDFEYEELIEKEHFSFVVALGHFAYKGYNIRLTKDFYSIGLLIENIIEDDVCGLEEGDYIEDDEERLRWNSYWLF